MKVAFLLDRPTQFDGPFFRYVAAKEPGAIHVFYLRSGGTVLDPELGRSVGWGLDLEAGYPSQRVPATGWLRWLWRELRNGRYDGLVVNGYNKAPYIAAALIAALRRIRVCVRVDSVLFNQAAGAKRVMKRIAYAFLRLLYHRFLATGTLAVEHLRHFGIPEDQIGLFPYTVDNQYFGAGPRELSKREAFVVLAVAKFNAREAPWDLLRAAENLDPSSRIALVLAGDGPDRNALEAFARERLRIPARFLGYVPYPELPSLYARANVFVHAAADERWGVSVQEAIAAGLPVIASSRVGAAYDLIVPGENGYLYDSGDAQDLRDKLLRVRELDPSSTRAANQRILGRWNYEGTWNRLREALQ